MSAKRKTAAKRKTPKRGANGRFVKSSSSAKRSPAKGRARGTRTTSKSKAPSRKPAPKRKAPSKSARAKEAQRRTERRATSRRIAGRKGTLPHFRRWSREILLDDGEPWELEDWQAEIVGEILGGAPVVWEVVPEGNGKTTLSAGVGVYHLDPEGWGIARPRVVLAASTSKQADWLFGQAQGIVEGNARLNQTFRVLDGFKRIRRREQKLARLDVFAGDDGAADGAIYSLAFVEELHRHRDLKLYRVWTGKRRKRKGQVVVTSTAGEPNSEFEEARSKILEEAKATGDVHREGEYGSHIRAKAGRVVLHDYAVRDPERANDMKVVLEANPFSAVKLEDLEENHDDPTISWEHFLRFSCNIPTRVEGQAWSEAAIAKLGPQEGEEALSPSSSAWKIGWLDLGWEIDTTAMGILSWESNECRLVTGIRVIEPPVDEGDIVEGLVYRQREFGPVAWVYDPHAGGQQMVQLLEKGEHPRQEGTEFTFIEHSQDPAPMALAAQRLDEAIRMEWLQTDGDPLIAKHFRNAVRKSLGGEKWRVDRPPNAKGRRRKNFPIDVVTGVLIGHSVAVSEHNASTEPIVALGKPR